MEQPKSKISRIIISLLVIVLSVISYWFYSYSVSQKEFENLLETQFQESENLRVLKLEEENNLRSQLDDIIVRSKYRNWSHLHKENFAYYEAESILQMHYNMIGCDYNSVRLSKWVQ